MKKDEIMQDSFSKLHFLNYSDNTIKIYLHYINEFLLNINITYSRLSANNIQSYLYEYDYKSISQQNQIISAIKFLFEKVFNKKYKKVQFIRPRKERKLPKVINKEFLIILKILNIKLLFN